MSYSNSFPQQRPTLNLVFNGGSDQLDSRLSYSRSSGGTYLSNEKALSSENLLPYSNDLSQSVWTKSRVTVASTNNAAPNGTTTASSLLETADINSHTFYDNFSCTSGQQYSFVFYFKANGRTKVSISPQATVVIATVQFDLTAVTSTVTAGSADSHSITAIGSTGWYKCAATVTATATGTGFSQVNLRDANGNGSYAGDVTKGILVWGSSVSSTGETVLNETSGSIHREYSPLLKTASADAPRFEYATDGQSVGTPKGLLVESQITQLLTYSEDFSNAAYTKYLTTVDSNAAIAPSGELTADKLTATSASGEHRMIQLYSMTSGSSYTISVYAKASGLSFLRLGAGSLSVLPARVSFNLSTGAVATETYGSGKIEAVGNGWYRCSVTATAAMTSTTSFEINVMQADNTASFSGDDYSGALLFGAMAEQSAHVSSYVSSTSSTTTRASDSCSVALNGILASGQDVTLYAEGDWGDYTVKPYNRFVAALSENNDTNWIALYNANSSGASYIKYLDAIEAVQTGVAANGNQKAAVSVAMNSINHAAAGVASAEDTNATVPPYTQLSIGNNRDSGTLSLNGHCTRVALYGQALSSSELAALTS